MRCATALQPHRHQPAFGSNPLPRHRLRYPPTSIPIAAQVHSAVSSLERCPTNDVGGQNRSLAGHIQLPFSAKKRTVRTNTHIAEKGSSWVPTNVEPGASTRTCAGFRPSRSSSDARGQKNSNPRRAGNSIAARWKNSSVLKDQNLTFTPTSAPTACPPPVN